MWWSRSCLLSRLVAVPTQTISMSDTLGALVALSFLLPVNVIHDTHFVRHLPYTKFDELKLKAQGRIYFCRITHRDVLLIGTRRLGGENCPRSRYLGWMDKGNEIIKSLPFRGSTLCHPFSFFFFLPFPRDDCLLWPWVPYHFFFLVYASLSATLFSFFPLLTSPLPKEGAEKEAESRGDEEGRQPEQARGPAKSEADGKTGTGEESIPCMACQSKA